MKPTPGTAKIKNLFQIIISCFSLSSLVQTQSWKTWKLTLLCQVANNRTQQDLHFYKEGLKAPFLDKTKPDHNTPWISTRIHLTNNLLVGLSSFLGDRSKQDPNCTQDQKVALKIDCLCAKLHLWPTEPGTDLAPQSSSLRVIKDKAAPRQRVITVKFNWVTTRATPIQWP